MSSDVSRADVWESFADQFLDTETRHYIPDAAFRAVTHGLTPAQAFDVWRFEVTPAVYDNLWSVAGEWAGWPRDWLAAQIEAKRGRWPNRPGPLGRLVYSLRIDSAHKTWVAIEHCMQTLLALPVEERARVAAQLVWLARHFFDFGAQPLPATFVVEEIALLYAKRFLPAFLPLVVEGSGLEVQSECTRRVQVALDQARAATATK